MDRFKKDALFILNDLILTGDKKHWYSKHNHYKWFLIRIEQYLNGAVGSTPNGQELYYKSIKAQDKPTKNNPLIWEIVEALELNII